MEKPVDVQRRMIHCAMKRAAPKDKKSTKAKANWLVRQLKKAIPESISIKAIRPVTALPTQELLKDLRENPERLESATSKSTATTLEVVYSLNLAAKFGGRKAFIDQLERLSLTHQEAGQWLRAWTPPAPKIQREHAPEQGIEVEMEADSQ